MRSLLLVSATAAEITPLLQHLNQNYRKSGDRFEKNHWSIEVCITGVGMVNTAYALGKLSSQKFDGAINLGVAGSFTNLQMASVVRVRTDFFSELGAEDDLTFISIDDMGFGKQCVMPEHEFIFPEHLNIPNVSAITVNTVHGNESSIAKVVARLNPEIESMEGAAFFYACNQAKWPCAQIRSISNQVEKRDKSKWKLTDAIDALNAFAVNLLDTITN